MTMSDSPAKGLLTIHENGSPYIEDVAAALYIKAVNHIWAATTADPEGKVRETELAIKDLERCQEICSDIAYPTQADLWCPPFGYDIDITDWQRMEERVRFELQRLRCEITFYRARLEEVHSEDPR